MATKKNEDVVMKVELPKIDLGVFTVQIIGDSPLIVHKWSHKAKEEMLGKIREIIKDMDEDTYDMFWKLVMNPDKDERMTPTEYADTKGVTQQAISKRLEIFLEKYRAQLGCKKKKRVLSK